MSVIAVRFSGYFYTEQSSLKKNNSKLQVGCTLLLSVTVKKFSDTDIGNCSAIPMFTLGFQGIKISANIGIV